MLARLVTALAGRYEIERELGRGGMATVYLAHDVRHDRHVAIKVLDPELGSTVGPDRFLREIATAARLTHPNILALHDSGDAAGLLYYVMPYVRGESLRRRLDRERQLPIEDALAIARQVASALDYAHLQGVVHRDIKPENILMGEGGQAIVADFGLARVLHDAAAGAPLTGTGMAVGTPAYMSPEQATADRAIDARTDVYSLGCVVYEMIAGLPPFRGATVQAVVAHHLATPAPSLCIDRDSCPESIDLAVRRALAKTPADRFRSAGEFVRAMDPDGSVSAGLASYGSAARKPAVLRGGSSGRRFGLRTLAVLGVLTAAAIAAVTYAALDDADASALDGKRLVIMPFRAEPGNAALAAAAVAVERQLRDALGEWDGLEIIQGTAVHDELRDSDEAGAVEGAIRFARSRNAGRLVRGELQPLGDSIVATLTSYDVRSGASRRVREVTYLSTSQLTRAELRALANAMVRDREELPIRVPDEARRPNLQAWIAYDVGRVAADDWNLRDAEARFREAVRLDPAHAPAQLWLAQTLTWSGDSAARGDLRHAAFQAHQLRAWLSPHDADLAAALLALVESRFADACDTFRRLIAARPRDFIGWYGLGDCQTRDPIVVVDARSPSGFSFRGSYHSGAQAYVRALETVPGKRPDFAYVRLGTVLRTQMNQVRAGLRVAGDTIAYVAYPALVSDTIAYVPYPAATLAGAMPDPAQRGHVRALERNRAQLRELLTQWVRASSNNARAHETLARLLETMGDIAPAAAGQVSALTATRTARSLAVDSIRRLELAADEVRLLLKNESFREAAALADSLLAAHPTPVARQASQLLGLAALTGRLNRATELLRALSSGDRAMTWEDGRRIDIPPVLAQRLAGASSAAMLGVCTDSVKRLSTWIETSLASHYVDEAERRRVRDAVMWRPSSHAVPCLGVGAVRDLDASDRLLKLQQALDAGGAAALRAGFDTLRVVRRNLRPGDVAIDYTYHEAWLLAAAGDTTQAIGHLDRTLEALSTLGTFLVYEPSQAAGLVRAMMLRARLASARGDAETARRWATAVTHLWEDADPALHADVAAMRSLAAAR